MQKKISKLPDDTRKDELQAWVTLDLAERFAGRIIDINLETALCWGRLHGVAEQTGEKLADNGFADCCHCCDAWLDCGYT